jgi:hypothetical protein
VAGFTFLGIQSLIFISMKFRSLLFLTLGVFTVLNIAIFFLKDHFQYMPYSSYKQLYKPCNEACKTKWGQFKNSFETHELAEAKKILQDSLKFSNATTQKEKIAAISKFVYRLYLQHKGVPAKAFQASSPLRQYKSLCEKNEGKLWCGNASNIFAFFCWAEGIATRNIEIMQPGDHHVVNECYLDESGEWVLADVTHQLVLVKNNNDQYLNLQNFRSALLNNEAVVNYSDSDIIKDLRNQYYAHYYIGNHPHHYYYVTHDAALYSSTNKIKRYLLPASWYEVYDSTPKSNLLFYVKQTVFVVWIILLLAFLFFLIRKRKN